MAINIGAIKSVTKTDDLQITPDDRQELVKTFTSNGTPSVTVEDYGVVADGEVISCSATFSSADYETLRGYWSNRTRVTVVLDDGMTINNARVVIKGVQYYDGLLSQYKRVSLEVWRV